MPENSPSLADATRAPITVREVSRWEDLDAYHAEWNQLAERSQAGIFQVYEWHQGWWRVFGSKLRLFVLLAFDAEERLLAVAPLAIERCLVNGWPQRVLRWIGSSNHSSDYCDFLFPPDRPEALSALLQRIVESRVDPGTGHRRWDQIDWINIPSHSPSLAIAERFLARHGLAVECHRYVDAPARSLGDPVADCELLNRKSLRRHFNHFQKTGRLEFRVCESLPEIQGWLERFFEQHVERRALTSEPSLFQDQRQRDFYRELAVLLQPRGWLHFSVVLHDGNPIAFHFGFEYGGKLLWYKPSFDARLARHSPGEVLLRFLFQYAIDRGLREFDFTVGNEGFKYRFADRIRGNHRLQAFSSPFQHGIFRLRRLLVRRASELLRRMRSVNRARSA